MPPSRPVDCLATSTLQTRGHGSKGSWEGYSVKQKEFTESMRVGDPGKLEWKPRLPWTFSPKEFLTHFPSGMTPRVKQIEALTEISDHFRKGKRVVVLEMPTGGGKSPICLTAARAIRAMGGKTSFLTIQKALQNQYIRDFPAPEIEPLKGRANYSCNHSESNGSHCGDAPCTKLKKGILPECVSVEQEAEESPVRRATLLELTPGEQLCPYWKQLQLCNDSAITLFNFSSFLFQQRIHRFGKRDLMLIDEAHNIETQVMGFVSVELTEYALSAINVRIDREVTSKDQLLNFLRENQVMQKIKKALDQPDKADPESFDEDLDKAEADAIRELGGKLETFLAYVEKSEWLYETVTYNDRRGDKARKIVARPIFAKDFAEALLFSKADRVLVMSATILDVGLWAKNLGLSLDEVGLVQTACDFPPERRPIHLEYAGNCGSKYFSREANPQDPTQPKFVRKIQQILNRHKGQRGIIHAQSFAMAQVIFQEVDNKRLIFQEHFHDKETMLSAHASNPDSVIVSPGIKEGFDFKGDLARFQILAKVPYPSLGDKVIKERADRDSVYYGWLTALALVQSYGRIVRSKDDWGFTYIVDSGFNSFFSRNEKLLPRWFKEAIKRYPPKEVTMT